MNPLHKKNVFFLLIVAASTLLVSSPAFAEATNYISGMTVTNPTCSGTDGRVSVDFTIDNGGEARTLTLIHPAGIYTSQNIRSLFPDGGSGSVTFLYLPIGGTQIGDVIELTILLGVAAGNGELDSMTIQFICSTGAIIYGPLEPVIRDDSITVEEGSTITFNVLNNDSDPLGVLDRENTSVVLNPSHGALVNNNWGSFNYIPDAAYSGHDWFFYRVCGGGICHIGLVSIYVTSVNEPPVCDNAHPSEAVLWPPNHQMAPISVEGIEDPDGDQVTVSILSVTSNEAEDAPGSGNTAPDTEVHTDGTVAVRAERSGQGYGRVYTIVFVAEDDGGATCTGNVSVTVAHDQREPDQSEEPIVPQPANSNRPTLGNGNANSNPPAHSNTGGNGNGNGNTVDNRQNNANGNGNGHGNPNKGK